MAVKQKAWVLVPNPRLSVCLRANLGFGRSPFAHSHNFEDTVFLFHNMGITQILSLRDQKRVEPNVQKMSQATILAASFTWTSGW